MADEPVDITVVETDDATITTVEGEDGSSVTYVDMTTDGG
jgi:hypothetical protein